MISLILQLCECRNSCLEEEEEEKEEEKKTVYGSHRKPPTDQVASDHPGTQQIFNGMDIGSAVEGSDRRFIVIVRPESTSKGIF